MNELTYSENLEMLFSEARAVLFDYPFANEYKQFSLSEKEIKKCIDELRDVVVESLNFLNGTATLNLTDDMEDIVRPALSILDSTVLLSEYLMQYNKINNEVLVFEVKGIANKCQRVFSHRLIPLNKWRREVRDNLPEDIQPLLSWYDEWSNIDDQSIQKIIDCYPDFQQLGNQPWVEALKSDIQSDRLFESHIKKCHELLKKTTEWVGQDLSLGLFMLSETCNADYELPSSIIEKGFYNVAVKTMQNPPLNKEDQAERLLFAAFTGPELDDDERLSIYHQIEEFLNNTELQQNSLLFQLQQWKKFKLESDQLVNNIFSNWLSLLEQNAGACNEIYQANSFKDAVSLLKESCPVDQVKDILSFISFIKVKAAQNVVTIDVIKAYMYEQLYVCALRSIPAYGAGAGYLDGSDDQPSQAEQKTFNSLELQMPEPQDNVLYLFEEEAFNDYRQFLSGTFFWIAIGVTVTNEVKTSEIQQHLAGAAEVTLENADYKLLVIGISDNEDVLRSVGSQPTDQHHGGIVWVFYVRPDVPDADDKGATSD